MALRLAAQALERALNWKHMGACAGEDPSLFFPISNQSDLAAKRLCAQCLVRAQCLDTALRDNELGVWGGTNERERRRIKLRYIRSRKDLAQRYLVR